MEFFNLQEEERKEFLNIPKLFYNSKSKFFNLTFCSKTLYPLLIDLNKNSIKNKICDNKNRIYIPTTLKLLSNYINANVETIYNSLLELQNFNLLKLFKTERELYIYMYNISFHINDKINVDSYKLDLSKYDERTKRFFISL